MFEKKVLLLFKNDNLKHFSKKQDLSEKALYKWFTLNINLNVYFYFSQFLDIVKTWKLKLIEEKPKQKKNIHTVAKKGMVIKPMCNGTEIKM